MPLLRFLPLVVLVFALGGCALLGDPPPARGCPPVYIVKEMSMRSVPGYTTRLHGVRDVTCIEEDGKLLVKAALLTEITVNARPQQELRLAVPLTVAAVSKTSREVVSRKAISHTVQFVPEDAPSGTRPLALEVALSQPGRIGTVYVGLVGGNKK